MILIVRILAKYALWIYILCGLGMLFYLRAALAARREGTQAIFSLERETAAGRVFRSAGMIVLLLLIAVGVYGLANYAQLPSTDTSPRESPTVAVTRATATRVTGTPTSSEPTATLEATATRRPLSTPVAPGTTVQDTSTVRPSAPPDCPHPNVQVVQPGKNQAINSGIEVLGTATKEQFDRYEFKFRNLDTQDEWHWVETFRTPVQGGSLGFWQTSHLPQGNYAFMLIAIDKTGNSQECVIPVVIQH